LEKKKEKKEEEKNVNYISPFSGFFSKNAWTFCVFRLCTSFWFPILRLNYHSNFRKQLFVIDHFEGFFKEIMTFLTFKLFYVTLRTIKR